MTLGTRYPDVDSLPVNARRVFFKSCKDFQFEVAGVFFVIKIVL